MADHQSRGVSTYSRSTSGRNTVPDTFAVFETIDPGEDFELREEALRVLEERLATAPIDIREPLSAYKPTADTYQQAVITASQATIRVVAPAGSGKTQTIVNRVLHRIGQGMNPARVLLLTFDNSAVSSLKEKLNKPLTQLSVDLPSLEVCTLNAFGYRMLRERFKTEYKPIVNEFRRPRILRELLDYLQKHHKEFYSSLPPKLGVGYYLDLISLLKNEIFDPRNHSIQLLADCLLRRVQTSVMFSNPRDRTLTKRTIQAIDWIYKAYEKALQQAGVLDFDDQKLRTYSCLQRDATVLTSLRGLYSEIIVDEFQDINKLDFALINLLSTHATLVVTGDDDQAIYGFRGCSPEYIINLPDHLKRDVTSYELSINYRCPANIVTHADQLIRKNVFRIPKAPIAHNSVQSQINIISSRTAGIEARAILSYIKRCLKKNANSAYKDFAILYRTNAQSLPLQIELVMNEIPYFVRDKDNILANESLEKLLGALRLKLACCDGHRPSTEDMVLCTLAYFRYVSGRDRQRLDLFFSQQPEFLQAIERPEFYDILPKAAKSRFPERVGDLLGSKKLLDCLDILSSRFHGVEGTIGSLEEVLNERVPLGEIYELAVNFRGDTREFVETIDRALRKAKAANAGKDNDNGVALLTYFKSKGLQWNTVILTTCNEGLIPHKKAEIEDERRLFYVAMTRTSSNLLVSFVSTACRNKVQPSRFLSEAGLLPK